MGTWMTSSVLKSAETDWLKEIVDAKQPPLGEFGWNDSGNADRLVAAFGEDLIYCRERKTYYAWTGTRWELDEFIRAEAYAEKDDQSCVWGCRRHHGRIQAKGIPGISQQVALENQPCKYAPLGKKEGAHYQCNGTRSVHGFSMFKTGLLTFRRACLRPHSRDDLISKVIPVEYDASADCPLFAGFIRRIMGASPNCARDADERANRLICYLQRLFGCAATGKPEKVLIVCCTDSMATTAKPRC